MASRLTIEQRTFVVKTYYETKSPQDVQRKFKHEFKARKGPSKKHIYSIVKKFERSGAVLDDNRSGRPRTSRSEENISTLNQTFIDSPTKSIRRASSEHNIAKSSVQRMLKFDFNLFPYKIQIMQSLSLEDQVERLDFCQWASRVLEENGNAFSNVWFSDECHFLLSGHVNKQNMRFWASEQPHEFTERPLHSEKVTVWCALSSLGIIGPFFFADTVNSERYLSLLRTKFMPALQRLGYNIHEQWFMQDGATPHTANIVLDYLSENFGERVLSRKYPEKTRCGITWPAHSPDFNPLDYFLWGHLKSKVYRPKPVDAAMLKSNIRRECRKVSRETCEAVLENFTLRVNEGKRQKGHHLENVINY